MAKVYVVSHGCRGQGSMPEEAYSTLALAKEAYPKVKWFRQTDGKGYVWYVSDKDINKQALILYPLTIDPKAPVKRRRRRGLINRLLDWL